VTSSTESLVRRPAAWLPILLSVVALVLIGSVLAIQGAGAASAAHDEGAPARVFQLLMLVDLLAIAYFGLRWVPAAPRQALPVLAVQVLAAAVPVATILLLER
jgi:hypothetical protein